MSHSLSHHLRHRANALVATLIVLSGVAVVLGLSADRLSGTRAIQSVNLARQQATYAAETVAALVESKLVQNSGDLANLTENINSGGNSSAISVLDRWLQQGFYASSATHSTGMWIGNCIVYWRIEPMKIYSQTITDTNGNGRMDNDDTLSGNHIDNYRANPNSVAQDTVGWPGTSRDELNPGYLHFRIVTHAFYTDQREWSANNTSVINANPWDNPKLSVVNSQTQRMVQLKLINLFRYVIFYGAIGKTGDIELFPGPDLDIRGAVHTNGALYLGGQGSRYTSGDYHHSASTTSRITVGAATTDDNLKATITGVDGIFRMNKCPNLFYQMKNPANSPSYFVPANIPTNLPDDDKKLNGNDSSSEAIKLNGVPLTYLNDSRSGLTDHNDLYVRDRVNRGAEVVQTLANIPELSGYPFEPQRIVGSGVHLYKTPAGADVDYTIRPQDYPGSRKLYYDDATRTAWSDASATDFPVYAGEMPLFEYVRGGKTVADVSSNLVPINNANNNTLIQGNALNPDKSDTFLPLNERRGYYLQESLYGDAQNNQKTGLTIRERGAQNLNGNWIMFGNNSQPITGVYPLSGPLLDQAGFANPADYYRALSVYMARNYVVYFGLQGGVPADITERFFKLVDTDGSPLANQGYTTLDDLPIVEDEFMNRREAVCYEDYGLFKNNNIAGKYKVNVLCLNMQRIQTILRTSTYNTLNLIGPATDCRNLFNGLIYVHRTPRLGFIGAIPTHDPSMPLYYHPLVAGRNMPVSLSNGGRRATPMTNSYGFNKGFYPIVGDAENLTVSFDGTGNYQIGAPNVWAVYPTPLQILVRNGRTIDWGGRKTSGRLDGINIVTPNHCYLQGDYNTTPDASITTSTKYPPCAIFADGITMLSNNWINTYKSIAYDGSTTPEGDDSNYILSLVLNNLPTDLLNVANEGSGGTHNLARFLEKNPSRSRNWRFTGSMVVLNRMRYNYSYNPGFYEAPTRSYNFNSDLFTSDGQPPYSLFGVQVTRVISSVNIASP